MFEKKPSSLREPKTKALYEQRLEQLNKIPTDQWAMSMFQWAHEGGAKFFSGLPKEEQEDLRRFAAYALKRIAAGEIISLHKYSDEDQEQILKGASFKGHDWWHVVAEYAASEGRSLMPSFRKTKSESDMYSERASLEEEGIVHLLERGLDAGIFQSHFMGQHPSLNEPGWMQAWKKENEHLHATDPFLYFVRMHRAFAFNLGTANLPTKNPVTWSVHKLRQAQLRRSFLMEPSPLYLDIARRYFDAAMEGKPLTSFTHEQFKRLMGPLLTRLRGGESPGPSEGA